MFNPQMFNILSSSVCFLSDEGPMLETLDHTIRIGSTPTFLYFDLYLYSAYAAHYIYIRRVACQSNLPLPGRCESITFHKSNSTVVSSLSKAAVV